MAFLNIGAVSAVPCVTPEASTHEPERGGADVRAFAGNLRSTVRWSKRSWQVTTVALPAASTAAIRAAITARPVSCSGDLLGGTVSCIVTETGGPFRKGWSPSAPKETMTLTIREV